MTAWDEHERGLRIVRWIGAAIAVVIAGALFKIGWNLF